MNKIIGFRLAIGLCAWTPAHAQPGVARRTAGSPLPMTNVIAQFDESFKKYPPIKVGTPEPDVPPT